ncbi:hypothetical protein [Gemmata sp.]|uniref:hypothetical protein n=1 Tax=Gemmata sp. TaxID=1914242 RepID=UPI003F6F8C12
MTRRTWGRPRARPKFHVQHFVACLNAAWEGAPSPRTLRTLEGVGHAYLIPPDTEFPFEEIEFWVYARFYRIGSGSGLRNFALETLWHDAPSGVRSVGSRSLGSVRFNDRSRVVSAAWPVRPLVFPGTGTYEFQLQVELVRSWGVERKALRSEFVGIERQP